MTFSRKLKRIARFLHEAVRLGALALTRVLFRRRIPDQQKSSKMFLLNLQYINAYSDLELTIGKSLIDQGHDVRAIICPGLTYCEREDYQTRRPDCASCQRASRLYCKAYGIDVATAQATPGAFVKSENRTAVSSGQTTLTEYVCRNYVHYFKSFGAFDPARWKTIETAAVELIDYVEALDLDDADIECVVTANGKFFQTGLVLDLLAERSRRHITWEVFGQDNKAILATDVPSLHQYLDMSTEELDAVVVDDENMHKFLIEQKNSTNMPFDLWGSGANESVPEITDQLKTSDFKKVVSFFPNVIWDSAWMGIGFFEFSPATFIARLYQLASRHGNTLFVVRVHPGEIKVPDELKSTSSIMSDLALQGLVRPSNIVIVPAESNLSSYVLSDLSEKVIFWNSTLGLELLCRGRKIACIADAYYSRQGITRNIENLDMLEAYLLEDGIEMLDERETTLAFKITYVTRNKQRFTSPVHRGRLPCKFIYPPLTSRGARFERNLADYCNGKIRVTEMTEGL